MPILFFILIGLLAVIFWADVVSNIAIIGSISTALAFMATAWAAFEARASAKAAMKAVRITAESLLETKKTSFKQWFELLLERHDYLHEELRKELELDSNLKLRIDMNIAEGFYYVLTKKPNLIKYINLIVSTLNYIDQDFYIKEERVDKRRLYVEQLNNRISSNVKLAIAVLGLNINNNKTYDQEKLYLLLTKYNFFENELFFDKAFENINNLDNYVTVIFNSEYRRTIEYYINVMIQKRSEGITSPIKDNYIRRHERLDFVIFWVYKNICGRVIRDAFNDLPTILRKSLVYNIENASVEIKKIKESAFNLIGCTMSVSGSKNIYLRSERHLTRLIDLYLRNESEIDSKSISFSNKTSCVYLDQFEAKIESYKLNVSLLKLNSELDKENTINDIISIVEQMIGCYKLNLERFVVKNKY